MATTQPVAALSIVSSPAPSGGDAKQSASIALTEADADAVPYLAVYGTLRDDDDSGAAYTAAFIRGIASARTGTVRGVRMYADSVLGYPFAVKSADPAHTMTVRVLRWADAAQWRAKLVEADAIEGFDPARPADGEYTRERVTVQLSPAATSDAPSAAAPAAATTANASAPESAAAWIYLSRLSAPKNAADWTLIPSGDWMKRDRTPKK